MTEPTINIITRTSNRPKYFNANRESVTSQGYDNVVHWVLYDDDADMSYLEAYKDKVNLIRVSPEWTAKEIENDCASPGTGARAPYNLYFNLVMGMITDGWVIILDDDDTLAPNALKTLVGHLTNNNDMALYQMRYMNGMTLPSPHMYHRPPMLGNIGSPCVCIHHTIAAQIKWDGWKCGDYRYIMKAWALTNNKKWIKKVLVNLGTSVGNLGKRNDMQLVQPPLKATTLHSQILNALAKNIVNNRVALPDRLPLMAKQRGKIKQQTLLHPIHETMNLMMDKLQNNVKFSFTRFGDNDIMQCNGEAKGKGLLGNNKTKFSASLQQELIGSMSIKDENYIKSYNIGISGYEQEKRIPLLGEERLNNGFLRYVRQIDSDKLLHSAYVFYYYSIYHPDEMNKFLNMATRGKKTMFIGGNDVKLMETIFGKITYYVKTPLYSASDHIGKYDKIVQAQLAKNPELDTIIVACGQLGRVLQKRIWKKYPDKYNIIDIGSIVDVYKNTNLRRYLNNYRGIIKRNITIK